MAMAATPHCPEDLMSAAQERLFYDPTVFNVPDEAAAKRIILTPEAGMTPEERWERETPDILARIARCASPGRESGAPDYAGQHWLDWGCGIGRIAKPLCMAGAAVTGVDISESMRRLAVRYVGEGEGGEADFRAIHPLDAQMMEAETFDAAVAVWSLQHSAKLAQDIRQIHRLLKRRSKLFVVNMRHRALPMMARGWVDDGLDVVGVLREAGFQEVEISPLPLPLYQPGAFWGVFER